MKLREPSKGGFFSLILVMPWYRIIIKKKHVRKSLLGIRFFDQPVYAKVEKEVHEQTYEKLGKEVVDSIQITKLPLDHPDVINLLAKQKKAPD